MESLPYIDALVKEYLIFRGFTKTFQTFCDEAQEAAWLMLMPETLVDVIFGDLIAAQQISKLWRLMAYLSDQIYSRISTDHDEAARRMELVVFQAYLVEAVKQNKRNNVRHFFEEHADDLLSSPDACTWQQWLALPYMKQPWEHRTFKAFFAPSWQKLARQMVLAFLSLVLPQMPLPSILQLQADRQAALHSAANAAALREENAQLREHLSRRERPEDDAQMEHVHSPAGDAGIDEGVELKELSCLEGSGVIAPNSDGPNTWLSRSAPVGALDCKRLSDISAPGSVNLDESLRLSAAPQASEASSVPGDVRLGIVTEAACLGKARQHERSGSNRCRLRNHAGVKLGEDARR